jgi:hypothetical protein
MRLIKLNHKNGALLVEIMLTTALFSIVSVTIASLTLLSSVMSRTNDAYARLNDNAMKILHYVSQEIKQTSATTRLVITPNDIRFQIPVDWNNNTYVTVTPLDAEVEWGAYDQAGQTDAGAAPDPNILNRWVRYQVVNNQLIRDVLVGPGSNSNVDPNVASVIVGNNIQGFDVALNNNRATITVDLRASDAVGQFGTQRNLDTNFSYSVYLRNAAN